MHTCLSLANVGGHWYVERTVSDLIEKLSAHCDDIDWCNIAVEGPSGEGDARSWRVDLKLRIFHGVVRAAASLPEGPDPEQSLTAVLAELYTEATAQIAHIAARSRLSA